MKILKILLLSLTVSTLLFGCSPEENNLKHKNVLDVDIGSEPATLDPGKVEDAEELRILNDLFAGLVDFSQSNVPAAGLASNWDITNNGKTYIFHLRSHLKFSDGSPIRASDFVYSWQRLVDPQTASPYNFLLNDVVNAPEIIAGTKPSSSLGVSAPDDHTFVVNLIRPDRQFLVYLTLPATYVVPQNTIKLYGNNWTNPKNMVTSGAYKLNAHVVNGYVMVQKNPYFYDAKHVTIEYVKYFPIVDSNVAISSYKTGELDTTWKNVPIDQFATIKQQFANQLHVTPAERTMHLSFNLKLPKYANNIKLRQALSMAIDRNVLTNEVLKSGQKPLYSIVTPTINYQRYANVRYTWADLSRKEQIAMAQKLYADAGYNAKHPAHITLSYFTNDLNKKTCLAIASMWQSILGANVKIQTQERKAFDALGHKGDFDIRLSTWGADYNAVTTYTNIYRCNNANNYANYCSNAYESYIELAQNTTSDADEIKLYSDAISTANNDYPVIPLYQPTQQRLVSTRVLNYLIDENYLDNVQSKWFTFNK
ncbi:MAG: peptide ABC transporter substrate-binding protein [Burkholderiales bacterium]|jgi:oligopeptide transport system substrate-binding protein|nr:peptide ABC transporter substrate-binding protein [Burkholderiales bacterium]